MEVSIIIAVSAVLISAGSLYLGILNYRQHKQDKAKEYNDKQEDTKRQHKSWFKDQGNGTDINQLTVKILNMDNRVKFIKATAKNSPNLPFSYKVQKGNLIEPNRQIHFFFNRNGNYGNILDNIDITIDLYFEDMIGTKYKQVMEWKSENYFHHEPLEI